MCCKQSAKQFKKHVRQGSPDAQATIRQPAGRVHSESDCGIHGAARHRGNNKTARSNREADGKTEILVQLVRLK
jgi:hypothetical protein